MPSWSGAGKGAATGASVGSIVPGWGTAIGAGVGALVGAFRGGGDKKNTPAATPGGAVPGLEGITKTLQDRAAAKDAQGSAYGDQGAQMLSQFAQYFRDMISDPLANTQVDRGRVIDQYDTARRSAAEFGPRGSGGGTAASAMSRISQANELSDITAGARSDAATQGAGVAAQLAQLGLSEEQLASMDLGQLIQAILGSRSLDQGDQRLKQDASAQRGQMVAGMAEGVGTLLGLYLTRNKA